MEIDKAKDVRKAYDMAIQAFSKKLNDDNADEIELYLEKIEDYKESYNYNNIESKKGLGLTILFGLLLIATGFDIGTREYQETIQSVVGYLATGTFSLMGLYTIVKGFSFFQNDRIKNQKFAEETIVEIADDYKRIK